MSPFICVCDDDFTAERRLEETRWLAELADGRVVIQDDGRPGQPYSAWKRLRIWVEQHRVPVVALGLEFRSHRRWLVRDAAARAFFLGRSLMAEPGGRSYHFYLLGRLGGDGEDRVAVHKYLVPEIIHWESAERKASECGHGILFNPARIGD